jgi:Na+-driven multidrug efflux pump
VLFLIPLIIILPLFWGLDGIWFAPPISDILSAAVTGIFFFLDIRRLDRKQLSVDGQSV